MAGKTERHDIDARSFMDELRAKAGEDWLVISSKRLMTLIADSAAFPTATLV